MVIINSSELTKEACVDQSTKVHVDYMNLFKNINVPYMVLDVDDPKFTILDENLAHAAIAMVERINVVGRPLLEAFPDVTRAYEETGVCELIESVRRAIKLGKPDVVPRFQYGIKKADGKYKDRYWSISHFPLIENGKVTAVYQMSTEITDEILSERRLIVAERRLAHTLSTGLIGTWNWDITQDLIVADKNLANMFGVAPKKAAAGLPLKDFIASVYLADRERVEREVTDIVREGGSYESEFRTLDSKGDVRWVIVRGSVDSDEVGSSLVFGGVIIDITGRKHAENNLNFLINASTQFSASLDYRKTLSTIAAMAVPNISDWCAVDLLNNTTNEIDQVVVAHKDPKKIAWAKELRANQGRVAIDSEQGVATVIRSGQYVMYPEITEEILVAFAKDEAQLKLLRTLNMSSLIIVPLILDGRPIGAITLISTESCIHYDESDLELAKGLANRAALAVYNARLYNAAQDEIKKRKQLQKELQTLNMVLEERVKIRTVELEETNKGLKTEINRRQKAERELKKYSKNLAASNQELQDFAYVASHDLQEPLRKIQAFGDILENEYGTQLGDGMEYLGRMRRAASRMSILINDLLEFSRVTTRSDPLVAVNLNTIAFEVVSDLEARIKQTSGFVEIGSLPVVWAEQTHMRQILQNLIGNALKFHREGVPPIVKIYTDPIDPVDKYYTIHIVDNGIGFEEKYLDRIFSVFQRLHSKDIYEGTGIGLAICRKIAIRYGGTITATSKKGTGSEFTFKIPVMGKESIDGSS